MPSRRSGFYGDVELNRALRAVGGSLKAADIDRIARASLQPMRSDMQTRAKPRRQKKTPNGKHLDQGIVIVRQQAASALKREFWLSMKGRAARIAHLVEFGTAPHDQPRRGIRHPGARAFPFARPAFEAKKDEAVEVFGNETWARIAGEVAKVAK